MRLPRLRLEVSDTFAFTFLLSAVIGEYLFALFVVLPSLNEVFVPHSVHIVLGTFVFLNILGNLYMTKVNDSSTRRMILPALLKPGWHFCAACEANSPTRAFHCNKCNVCVLKRDHHCTFACCCIGIKNFRYFLVFLAYLALGAFYASIFNLSFIWDVLGGFSLFSVAAHLVPFVFFLFGYLSFKAFVYTFMSMLSVCGILFVTNLFILHFRQMLHNQTTFERNHGIFDYDLGWKNNIVECLGKSWYLVWLCPLIISPLPSDGFTFKINKKAESAANGNQSQGNLRQRHIYVS